MSKLTVQSLIDAGVPARVGNLCATDVRFYQYINSFEERALAYGRWWGTTALMQFCATPSCKGVCLTLPREVAVVEAMTVGGEPVRMRNAWYSYIRPHASWGARSDLYPFGSCGCGCGCTPAVSEDHLTVPCFATVSTGQKIRFYFDPADVGKTVLVQGYDKDSLWVRSQETSGIWVDGERVTFTLTGGEYYTDTSTIWQVGSPSAIQKDITTKRVLMFAVNTPFALADAAQQLADYQPSETLPSYRKIYLPGARGGSDCDCSSLNVKCIVSLAKVPVASPTDWLLFSNAAAYLDGIKAELLRDNNDIVAADRYFFGGDGPARSGRRGGYAHINKLGGALPTLQADLRKNQGDLTTTRVARDGVILNSFV